MTRKIVILATPSAQSLEVAGPMEVFGTANFKLREAGRERGTPYELELASTGSNLRIRSTMAGLQLVATAPWNRLPDGIDTLLIVGGVVKPAVAALALRAIEESASPWFRVHGSLRSR